MQRLGNKPALFRRVRVVLSDGSTYWSREAVAHAFVTRELDERNNPQFVTSSLDGFDDESYTRRMEAELKRKESENTIQYTSKVSRKNRPRRRDSSTPAP
mmetsp:Transcript_19043/g.51156  ORF Transcript_19043/g.51156 Transcript_19043/m.51156 type:complete len:100 (-) Transcript_19043:683-982(-)